MTRLYAALAVVATILLLGWYGHHATWDAATAVMQAKLDQSNKDWQAKLDKANADAQAEQSKLQAKIDAQAGPSNAELSAQFQKIQGSLDDMKAHDQTNYHPRTALPADCKLDAERIAAANKALSK